MSGNKKISMESYQWGHFGAIMADTIVFLIIAYLSFGIMKNPTLRTNGNTLYKLKWITGLSIVFAVITLLGLIPIFNKDYEEIIIN